MKTIFYFFIIGLFCSCSPAIYPKYYDPVMLQLDISYQPKPSTTDSLKSANYVSLGICQKSTTNDSKDYDMINGLSLEASRAHTFKNINLSYGGFGVVGYLNNGLIKKEQPYYFDKKTFSVIGIRGSVNAFVTKNSVDYRCLGVEFAYSKEYGDFSAFRKTDYKDLNYLSVHNTSIFTAGITSEAVFHEFDQPGKQVGVRIFLGHTFTKMMYNGYVKPSSTFETPDRFVTKAAVFIQIKRYYAVIEGGKDSHVKLGCRF